MIESAAQDYSVTAREHIASAEITVVDLRLRNQHLELPAHGTEFLIIEQRARAQAGTVEDDLLRQSHDFFTTAKFLNYHAPAGNIEIAQQSAQINRRFDQHRAELLYIRKAEIMFRIAMNFDRRIKIIAAR